MGFSVLLTQGAERDLEEISDFVAVGDGAASAEALLDHLVATCHSLRLSPERGSFPRELLRLGIQDYRQLLFAPYRLIYQVRDDAVVIFLIAHERREFQSLLERRLLS